MDRKGSVLEPEDESLIHENRISLARVEPYELITDESLMKVVDGSVGQIFMKMPANGARFVSTGFVIATACYESKWGHYLRILVMSCAHSHREIYTGRELYFSLERQNLK